MIVHAGPRLPSPGGRSGRAQSGTYFDELRATRADAQAYDPGARARLREISRRLTGLD